MHVMFLFLVFHFFFINYMFQVAKSCFVPVLLGHAVDDDFIHPHHSERIYEAYVVNFLPLILSQVLDNSLTSKHMLFL